MTSRLVAVVLALAVATGCSSSSPSSSPSPSPSRPASDGSAGHTETPARCRFKPNDDNTGARGVLEARDDEDVVLDDGESLTGARVHDLAIIGDDVVVRDVETTGTVLVTGDRATLEYVTSKGIAVSSASGAVIRYANITAGASDGIHVTSDRGRMARNVVLSHNFVHSPQISGGNHYDGTQVRGVNRLLIECSVYDSGPYLPQLNANVFIEDANGGAHGVTITSNWLAGSGFAVMVDGDAIRLLDNRVSNPHWGSCYLGASTPPDSVVVRGNVDERTQLSDPMCLSPESVG